MMIECETVKVLKMPLSSEVLIRLRRDNDIACNQEGFDNAVVK